MLGAGKREPGLCPVVACLSILSHMTQPSYSTSSVCKAFCVSFSNYSVPRDCDSRAGVLLPGA